MKKAIADFTETERWVVDTTLKERYGKAIEVKAADVELRLSPADRFCAYQDRRWTLSLPVLLLGTRAIWHRARRI
jgi:hypothetical protein